MTLEEVLREKAKEQPHKIAFVLGERKVSYLELEESSNKIANQLTELPLEKGDRVAFLLPNSPEIAISYFGTTKAGGIAAPLDPRLKPEELNFLIEDCQPKVLIGEEPFLKKVAPNLPKFSSIKQVIEVNKAVSAPFLSYWEILSKGSAEPPQLKLAEEDIVLFRYSSGTTGRPKAATIAESNFLATLSLIGEPIQQTKDDIYAIYATPPGWFIAMAAPALMLGGINAIVPGLALSQLLETISKERVTIVLGFPFIYQEIINMPDEELGKYNLGSVRLWLSSGAPLPIAISEQFKQRFGFDIIQSYGTVEAVSYLALQPLDGTGKPGSVGKSPAASELRIVDELGNPLPPNQVGEITVRNAGVMKGYYNRPQATAEALKEGWFHGGDLGKLDEDGYLFIVGRKKELIVVEGQNVLPIDIEEVLRAYPKVAEAAIVGIPDEVMGEAIRAVIVPQKGAVVTSQEIETFCEERLASYEIPKEIVFRDSLPKTEKGTIRKEELKRV